MSKLFETIIAHAPDKKQLWPRIKLFFEAFEHELTLPNPELWTIYDMISALYEHCAAELVPEDTFVSVKNSKKTIQVLNFVQGLLKYLWAARILETRYVSQTVAYTLCKYCCQYCWLLFVADMQPTAFLARNTPQLLPDTIEGNTNVILYTELTL